VPKISVEIPRELLDDLDEHVGDDGKFVNRSDAVRASIRKTLDVLVEVLEQFPGDLDAYLGHTWGILTEYTVISRSRFVTAS